MQLNEATTAHRQIRLLAPRDLPPQDDLAGELDVPGRSKMSRKELVKALADVEKQAQRGHKKAS